VTTFTCSELSEAVSLSLESLDWLSRSDSGSSGEVASVEASAGPPKTHVALSRPLYTAWRSRVF
jgi:hypothetical protein